MGCSRMYPRFIQLVGRYILIVIFITHMATHGDFVIVLNLLVVAKEVKRPSSTALLHGVSCVAWHERLDI